MSAYRCAGCGEYRRRPEYRRLGLSAVCSEACLWLTADRRLSKLPRPQEGKSHSDVPAAVRVAVGFRDRGRCRCCGVRKGLHLHHIYYRSQGGPHDAVNLVTLCHGCHAMVHGDKKRYQPVLLAMVWLDYAEDRHLSLAQTERYLKECHAVGA